MAGYTACTPEAHVLFVLSLLACKDRQGGDGVDDTADTGTPDNGVEEQALITTGPELGDCTPQTGSDGVALSGVLLLESGPEFGVVLTQDGEITCVGDCDISQSTVVCTEVLRAAVQPISPRPLLEATQPRWSSS